MITVKRYDEVVEENEILRELLWFKHGCAEDNLCDDDGELQCSSCGIDFKRDHVLDIATKLTWKPEFDELFTAIDSVSEDMVFGDK